MLKILNTAVMFGVDPIMAIISELDPSTTFDNVITHVDGCYEPAAFKFNGDKWLSGYRIENETEDYGGCDNIQQVLDAYQHLVIDPDNEYVITLTSVKKEDESSEGGWRWHKWGDYIGDKTPQCEYIADEGDDIQEVFCYTIHKIL